jgi:hypothetical protein
MCLRTLALWKEGGTGTSLRRSPLNLLSPFHVQKGLALTPLSLQYVVAAESGITRRGKVGNFTAGVPDSGMEPCVHVWLARAVSLVKEEESYNHNPSLPLGNW